MPIYTVVDDVDDPGPIQHPAITLVDPDGGPYNPATSIPSGTYVKADWLDARDYGVVATVGTATLIDTTAALQTAGETAIAAKKGLILPAGNIYVAGAITWTSALSLIGVSASQGYRPTEQAWAGGTVIIGGTGVTTPVITMDGAGAYMRGFVWRDFHILGSTNYLGGTNYAPRPAVRWHNVASIFSLDNVHVSGFLRQAWDWDGVQDGEVNNCRVYRCGTDGTYYAWDMNVGTIINNVNAVRFKGSTNIEGCPAALKIDGPCRHIEFEGLKIEIGPGTNPANSPVLIETGVKEVAFNGGQFTCNNAQDTGEYPGGAATAPYMFRIKNDLTTFRGAKFTTPPMTGAGSVANSGAKWINHDGAGIDLELNQFSHMVATAYGVVVGSRAQLRGNRFFVYPSGGLNAFGVQLGADSVVDGGQIVNADAVRNIDGGTMFNAVGDRVRVRRTKLIGLGFGAGVTKLGGANAAAGTYEADGDEIGSALLPWRVTIPGFSTPSANTNWNTVSVQSEWFGGRNSSSSTQNDSVSFDVVLAAGTWTLDLFHAAGSTRGIYTVALDGAALTTFGAGSTTIDGYAASTIPTKSSITGIVIPTTIKRRLSLTMATKNASSGGYLGSLDGIALARTA